MAGSGGSNYMARLKSPSAVGDLSALSVVLTSSYGTLSGSAARARGESLYMPMVPAVLSYSQVPIGEVAGLLMAGGYGQTGDFLTNAAADVFQIMKNGAGYLMAVPKK